MNKSFLKIAREVISKNKTKILTGLSICGVFGTAFLASKATLHANDILLGIVDDPAKLKLNDKVKLTWKEYIPAGLSALGTIICLLQTNRINKQEQAALLALYSLINTKHDNYKNKVIELLGKGQNKKIEDAIYQNQIALNPIKDKEVIFTGNGEVLCYDSLSGRYFKSDIETIKRKENELNTMLRSEMSISLNELYYELGLPPIKLGDWTGFCIDQGLITFSYSSQLTDTNIPCLVLYYEVVPI